jgi:hypothetical protein
MKGSLIRAGMAFALAAGSLVLGVAAPTGAATANQCKVFKGYATFNPPVSRALTRCPTITVHGTVPDARRNEDRRGTVTGTLKGKPGNCTTTGQVQCAARHSNTKWKNGSLVHRHGENRDRCELQPCHHHRRCLGQLAGAGLRQTKFARRTPGPAPARR